MGFDGFSTAGLGTQGVSSPVAGADPDRDPLGRLCRLGRDAPPRMCAHPSVVRGTVRDGRLRRLVRQATVDVYG